MLDLDFFKQINDVHGHPAGDSMLKAVAELLLANCRASDFVCRYGGEEFCILLPETNEAAAAAWAQRVRQRLAALRVPAGRGELRLTGSFGVAQCGDDTQDSEELVDLADQALLCAKRAGRDRVVPLYLVDRHRGTGTVIAWSNTTEFRGHLCPRRHDPLGRLPSPRPDDRRGRPIFPLFGHGFHARAGCRRHAGRVLVRKGPPGRDGLARLLATTALTP